MQSSPFSLISLFREQKLRLSTYFPGLQPLVAVTQLPLSQLPHYPASPIAANPLSVDINVDIDIEAAFDVHSQIGGRN